MSVDMSSKIDELAHNMGEVINRADALMDKFEKNEGDIAGIQESLEAKAKLLIQNLSWTVSSKAESDTNFNTLQKALDEASKYQTIKNFFITITIKPGYQGPLNIILNNVNLSYVRVLLEGSMEGSFTFNVKNSNLCDLIGLNIILNAVNSNLYFSESIYFKGYSNIINCNVYIKNLLINRTINYEKYVGITDFRNCNINIENIEVNIITEDTNNLTIQGLTFWSSVAILGNVKSNYTGNRQFNPIYNVNSNIEIGNIETFFNTENSFCSSVLITRGGFVSIVRKLQIVSNITLNFAYIAEGFVVVRGIKELNNNRASNITKGVLTADGGYINI
ncbi:hypothetical protein UPTC15744_00409 [Campylobacter lari]|uniref:hypothetical protein n=1 Tax=Campylobacter TaxID=194 RepID=UPI0021530BCB|nr:hypothetical protein [Campylobacter lari]MCR6535935.1 hypothetical protein [Campylobacter lari]